MPKYFIIFLVLGSILPIKCELNLKILKSVGDSYIPIQSHIVEEKAGTNFSLLCDLMSTDDNLYDRHLSWVKQQNDVRFWKEEDFDNEESKKIYSIITPNDKNKAVKRFQPLRSEDKGKYICISLQHNLFKTVEVVVTDDTPRFEVRPMQDTFSCSEQMYQCSNGYCIYLRYVCDGKKDCKDGSDESYGTCNGDPCKDKLQCDDGRCIPTAWCCDRHVDPNCTVQNRPECCQLLTNSYDDREYGSTPQLVHTQNNSARYVFISVCILSILCFIALLFLLLSRVVLFAKKNGLHRNSPHHLHHHHHHHLHPRHHIQGRNIENIALHSPYRFQSTVLEICDVSDPLLCSTTINFNNSNSNDRDEQPPPYVDAIRDISVNLNEPPPPYTSREALNNNNS